MKTKRNQIELIKFHSAQRLLFDGHKRHEKVVWRCGRRFGKTTALEVTAIDLACMAAKGGKRVGWFSPNYKLLTPSYKRILKTIRPLVAESNKVEGIITLKNQAEIEFWTLSDEDAGRSRYYDLAIIDEGSLVKKGLRDTWEQAISPTLLDRGGKAIMAGTPKGIDPNNFFYEACNNKSLGWVEYHMPTRSNPKLDPERVAGLENKYPPLVYQQEYLADFVDWSGAAFFGLDKLLQDGQGVPFPEKCDYVFATVDTAVKTGQEHDSTAVTFWARNLFYGTPLIALDWDIVQIDGALLIEWLPGVLARLNELSNLCGSRRGSAGCWIEDKQSGSILLQQGMAKGWPVHAIDTGLTAKGKDERAISVSGYVYQGQVKISQYAHDKRKLHKNQDMNHFESQVCGFRIGMADGKQADDLADTFMYGVSIGLGNADGY